MPKLTKRELEYRAKYRAKNPEKIHAANAEYQRQNRTATNLKTRRWQLRNKDYFRERHLKRSYDLTLEQLRDMLEACGHRCVCGVEIDEYTRHIDHDHVTGKVRGLLCQNCNRAIGMAQENPHTLERLAAYIRNGGR